MFFLLIVTTNVFQRPFCRREMDEAFSAAKPFVCVQEVEPRFAPWDAAVWCNSEEYRTTPWQNDPYVAGPYDTNGGENEALWGRIKAMVATQTGDMLPYRRRNFEAAAMFREMLRRCHIVEDLSEPHPAVPVVVAAAVVAAAAAAAETPTGRLPQHQEESVLLVHGAQFGAAAGGALRQGLEASEQRVRVCSPGTSAADAAADVAGTKAVVLLLTRGALSEPGPLAWVSEALSAGQRIVLVQHAHSATCARAQHR